MNVSSVDAAIAKVENGRLSSAGGEKPTNLMFSCVWMVAVFLYAALVTAVCVHLAYVNGPLVGPPKYDDISYFVWTLRRLDYLNQFGFVAFVVDHFRHPPHSPLSTALAYFAFGVFGRNIWSCYAANFFVVAAFFSSVCWAARCGSPWTKASLLMYASTISYTTCCVWNFRPDLFWGVFAAWSCFYILQGSWKNPSGRLIVYGAALVASAFLSKPSIFPATAVTVAAALALNLLVDRPGSLAQAKRQLLNGGKLIGLGVLISAPYYVTNFRHLFSYIKEVAFGRTGHDASFARVVDATTSHNKLDEFRCYFDGYAGAANFGGNEYILVSAVAVAVAILVLQHRRQQADQLICGAVLLCVFFAIPTFTTAKGTFFASNFVVGLILLAVWSIASLQARLGALKTICLNVTVVILCFASIAMKSPLWPDASNPAIAQEKKMFEAIYELIIKRSGDRITNFTIMLEQPLLAYDFLFRSAIDRKQLDYWNSSSVQDYVPADFVIAQEPGVFGVAGAKERLTKTLSRLRTDPDFYELGSCPSWNGKSIFVFERLSDFYGVSGSYGLFAMQRNGPIWRYRIASADGCGLVLQNHGNRRGGILVLNCVSGPTVRSLVVTLGGKSLASHQFKQTSQPEEIVVPVPQEVASNPTVDVHFESHPGDSLRPVTFTRMKFVDLPGRALDCRTDQASAATYPQNPLNVNEW